MLLIHNFDHDIDSETSEAIPFAAVQFTVGTWNPCAGIAGIQIALFLVLVLPLKTNKHQEINWKILLLKI